MKPAAPLQNNKQVETKESEFSTELKENDLKSN